MAEPISRAVLSGRSRPSLVLEIIAMPRAESAYFIINWPERFVVRATTKKRAAELAHAQLQDPSSTSANALTARTSLVYYCVRHRVFWFQLRGAEPRLLAPALVPEELYPWVRPAAAPDDFDQDDGHAAWDLPDDQTFADCQLEHPRIGERFA